ncbi:apoptosis inhibitor IAP [Reticulomyxa filosa]|uniref:Apoptosis inhibitor IAP n=1 Tax=Reticulomyxa filosa TaxID=46433 RepID=X6NBG7_RETFI|nr:apoptosis inhibitor IAP [Reticulomyxa filosa]|eukprot:ETO23341.1 apoptosis inhibitor IAP [Reticulomyxa filosa]
MLYDNSTNKFELVIDEETHLIHPRPLGLAYQVYFYFFMFLFFFCVANKTKRSSVSLKDVRIDNWKKDQSNRSLLKNAKKAETKIEKGLYETDPDKGNEKTMVENDKKITTTSPLSLSSLSSVAATTTAAAVILPHIRKRELAVVTPPTRSFAKCLDAKPTHMHDAPFALETQMSEQLSLQNRGKFNKQSEVNNNSSTTTKDIQNITTMNEHSNSLMFNNIRHVFQQYQTLMQTLDTLISNPSFDFDSMECLRELHCHMHEQCKKLEKNIILSPFDSPHTSLSKHKLLHPCQLCRREEKSILFLPCAHVATCSQCSNPLSKCPLCNTLVNQKIHVLFFYLYFAIKQKFPLKKRKNIKGTLLHMKQHLALLR